MTGIICHRSGNPVTSDSPASPVVPEDQYPPWHPFRDRIEFEVADFLYRQVQMSAGNIDHLMSLWSATLKRHGDNAPFTGHRELHRLIDGLSGGSTPWESFNLSHGLVDGSDSGDGPPWVNDDFEFWYRDPQALIRDIVANRSFADEFDYAPYHDYDHGKHRFSDFMSGDWAWRQAVSIFYQISTAILNLCRTKYMNKIRLHLALFLFPSSWEVTRHVSPLLQGTMNTGRSIYQLGISTTVFVEGTAMELLSWHSWPLQSVGSCNDIF